MEIKCADCGGLSSDVRLVLHLENVPIAHGKNVAASIGFPCNVRVKKTLGLRTQGLAVG